MVMLSARWTGPVTSKNWKIALQLKLRNFCMRPARRIIDTGRASYVWRCGCFKIIWKHIHSTPSSAYPYISHQHRQFHNNKSYRKAYFIDKEKAPSRALVRNFYLYAFWSLILNSLLDCHFRLSSGRQEPTLRHDILRIAAFPIACRYTSIIHP